MIISWNGPTVGTGAFPMLNRQFIAALRRHGHEVYVDSHMDGNGILTPIYISCTYPPQPVRIKHRINICLSTWEFHGLNSAPLSFIQAFDTYDGVYAMCQQAADSFIESGATNVIPGVLGVDPAEFTPSGEVDRPIGDQKVALWVGGTDERHGLDTAVVVAKLLPSWTFVLKLDSHYPDRNIDPSMHNILVLRRDAPSLAPLYRGADVLLVTARAVAPSLPILEALACGTPIIAPDLPAIREATSWLDASQYRLVPVQSQSMNHHLHHDCRPCWHVSQPEDYEAVLLNDPPSRLPEAAALAFGALWSWDDAAAMLEDAILDLPAYTNL